MERRLKMTRFDYIVIGIGLIAVILVLILLYLNDWDIEAVMFQDED